MTKNATNIIEASNDEWTTVVEPFAPTWSFERDGNTIAGVYLASRTTMQDTDMPGEQREAKVYEILTEDGQKYSVWGAFALDAAFEKIGIGEMVRVIWHGKVTIGGGRTVNQFTVQTR